MGPSAEVFWIADGHSRLGTQRWHVEPSRNSILRCALTNGCKLQSRHELTATAKRLTTPPPTPSTKAYHRYPFGRIDGLQFVGLENPAPSTFLVSMAEAVGLAYLYPHVG